MTGYDGGDCCQCTCVSTDLFTCGNEDDGGFACIDPSAECVDDDDFTDPYYGDDDEFSVSFFFDPCAEEFMGDGDCDASNNNEECGGSTFRFSTQFGRAHMLFSDCLSCLLQDECCGVTGAHRYSLRRLA